MDDIYTINGVHAKREVGEEKNLEYKITFDKHPDSSFWEPRENIPSFLIRNYEAGKSNIPQAKIKEVIKIGQQERVILTWEDNDNLEPFVPSENITDPEKEYEETPSECNTRKNLDGLFHRRTAGIFIGAWPCGIVPLFSEVYGTENVAQVHGLISDFLFQNDVTLHYLLYDDACHLLQYALNAIRMAYHEGAKRLGETLMKIDSMHWIGHKGEFCEKNCDPTEIDALKNVNSQVCEQKFNFTNKFRNTKTMNYLHYNLFLFYMFECSNLRILKRLHEIKPKYKGRQSEVTEIANKLTDMEINNNMPETESIACPKCDKTYTHAQSLNRHVREMHHTSPQKPPTNPSPQSFPCPHCGKNLRWKKTLKRHMENNCKKPSLPFPEIENGNENNQENDDGNKQEIDDGKNKENDDGKKKKGIWLSTL